jgi:hypothetical protein
MDTAKRQTELVKPAARATRIRLASPRKQLNRTIQKMTKLSERDMKPEKLVDLLIRMSELQARLLDIERDATRDKLIVENERLKSDLAARSDSPQAATLDDDALQMLAVCYGAREKTLEAEVENFKSQNSILEQRNSELHDANAALLTANSESSRRVQTLEQENIALQEELLRLQSRTFDELMAEVRSRLAQLSAS